VRLPTVLTKDGPVVIFGAGEVGFRKVEYMLQFTDDVRVVDSREMELPGSAVLRTAEVTPENMDGFIPDDTVLVIAAFSDAELNHEVARRCRARGILVNVVDDPPYCDVHFPALARSGALTLAISTGGGAPFLSRKIREDLESYAVEMAPWLDVLAPIRKLMVGMDTKNRVLGVIYDDAEVRNLISQGSVEEASARARRLAREHAGDDWRGGGEEDEARTDGDAGDGDQD